MAEPCAGEGVELNWRLHLKQNRSAIDQADRLRVDGPRGSGSGQRSKANCYDYGACAEPPGFAPSTRCGWSAQALARRPRRLSPHEFFAIRKLHLTSLAPPGIPPL